MFVFRSLYEKLSSTSSGKAELANVDGCFYLVRPTVTVKGSKECIFQTSIASIRRTSQPFQYELVVNRSVEEGQEAFLDAEAEDALDEYVTLIDGRMQFRITPASETDSDKPGAVALAWLDLAGDEDDSYLLVVEDQPTEKVAEFELMMYRCMWERDNNRDAKDAKKEELMLYSIQHSTQPEAAAAPPAQTESASSSRQTSPRKPLFRAPSPSSSDDEVADELTAAISKLKVSSKTSSEPAGKSGAKTTPVKKAPTAAEKGKSPASASKMYPAQPELDTTPMPVASSTSSTPAKAAPKPKVAVASPVREPEPEPEPEIPASAIPSQADIASATRDPPDERQLMLSEECDINLFDAATSLFMLQEGSVVASLWLVRNQAYTCWLSVAGQDGFIWISTQVDGNLPLHFEEQQNSIILSFNNERFDQHFTWLLRFNNRDVYMRMNDAFTQGIFEASNGIGSWQKLKPDEQRYNRYAYTEDVEMADVEPYPDEEDEEEQQPQQEFEEELYSEEEESEESEEEESEEEPGAKNKAKNSLLAVGYKGMSFVVRGDMIGVFENQKGTGKKLKFITNISGIGRPGSKSTFVPNKVMLHNQDMTMVLSDPMNPNSLYKLDLTTGKVIEEWKVSENLSVNNFIPDSKYAQTTQQQTFIGTSHNGIFRIDPRLSGNKLVDSEYKQYASKNDFSAAATTESGRLAVTSNKGEIRLFDSIGKNAKTALPAIGQPIIGVDVSADGRYVVATCKTYLLFIDTKIGEGRYAGQSGFDRSFPADAKPIPRRLKLKQEHELYVGDINFTPAKFNTGPDVLEKTIITSTGPFVIAFNFRSVKSGKNDYKIKRYDETVVADNFRYGDDREIVVTMPNDLKMEAKSQLQAPSRQSLAPGGPQRKSGIRTSNIVQQWDG